MDQRVLGIPRYLSRQPLFAELSPIELERLASGCNFHRFNAIVQRATGHLTGVNHPELRLASQRTSAASARTADSTSRANAATRCVAKRCRTNWPMTGVWAAPRLMTWLGRVSDAARTQRPAKPGTLNSWSSCAVSKHLAKPCSATTRAGMTGSTTWFIRASAANTPTVHRGRLHAAPVGRGVGAFASTRLGLIHQPPICSSARCVKACRICSSQM